MPASAAEVLRDLARREFWKMTGSGNDFVFLDCRETWNEALLIPEVIQRICHRRNGIGADGVVFLRASSAADFAIRYHNADGSLASLCGNATLCATRLGTTIGAADPAGLRIATDAGLISARVAGDDPEIDLQPVTEVRPAFQTGLAPGERKIGYAMAGVPHLTALVDDLESVPLEARGAQLRHEPTLPHGANANFVGRAGGRWAYRTYERGVEGETLACGTGAVATALLLLAWGEADGDVVLETRSGLPVTVRLRREADRWFPSLQGEGRIVYSGRIGQL